MLDPERITTLISYTRLSATEIQYRAYLRVYKMFGHEKLASPSRYMLKDVYGLNVEALDRVFETHAQSMFFDINFYIQV